ncbi:MAG: 2Fe-2S iron-sulfur cluster-binding protein [Campylobacterota bacterium]|nr:2Fe-2S iron-sulfur cluster-binding protein [Campylobacterota bacterium]
MQITCKINDIEYSFECEADERAIDILRNLACLSVKEGCGEGECGACSIFFNSKLINSCLLLAPQMDTADIITLEGLQKETEKIRENFAKEGAVQCGFCIPGFVMRAYDYIEHDSTKDERYLKESLDGNVCRCTGYQKIVDAILKSMP